MGLVSTLWTPLYNPSILFQLRHNGFSDGVQSFIPLKWQAFDVPCNGKDRLNIYRCPVERTKCKNGKIHDFRIQRLSTLCTPNPIHQERPENARSDSDINHRTASLATTSSTPTVSVPVVCLLRFFSTFSMNDSPAL